jgi:hypothetical protein
MSLDIVLGAMSAEGRVALQSLPMLFEAVRSAPEHERDELGLLLLSYFASPGPGKRQALLHKAYIILDRQALDGPRPEPDEQEAEHFGATLRQLTSASGYFREWGRLLVEMPRGEVAEALYRKSPFINLPFFFRVMEEDGSVHIWNADREQTAQPIRDRINQLLGDKPGSFLIRDSASGMTRIPLYDPAVLAA